MFVDSGSGIRDAFDMSLIAGLVWTLIVFSGAVSADLHKLPAEFTDGPPYYVMKSSKSGNKYFVVPSGGCTCPGTFPASIECSTDLQKDLEIQLEQKKRNKEVSCPPDEGCAPGQNKIFTICIKNQKKK